VILTPLPALWTNSWTIILAGAGSSAAITAWGVVTVSLRQRLVPRELFGRVNASYRFVGGGAMALSALIGGVVARHNDLRAPYLVAGSLLAVTALPGLRSALRYAR
jgi:MFS family permease